MGEYLNDCDLKVQRCCLSKCKGKTMYTYIMELAGGYCYTDVHKGLMKHRESLTNN